MFTGLVEELGKVRSLKKGQASAEITIAAGRVLEGTKIGDSIAVNGVCLTVTTLKEGLFTAAVMAETLAKTSLGELSDGDVVNLERAMQLGDRLGGHLVSGHVDGVGKIIEKTTIDIAIITKISLPVELIPFILPKGSAAVDGISLTVVETGEDYFTVSLIPHTAKETTLGYKQVGHKVNIETDMLGKYVFRFTQFAQHKGFAKTSAITVDFLAENGFI